VGSDLRDLLEGRRAIAVGARRRLELLVGADLEQHRQRGDVLEEGSG